MINRLVKHIFPILALFIVLILTGCDRIGMFGIASGNILILHVSSTGDDTTGDGSIESPYLTIQKALSEISGDNAQIQVATGTYGMTETLVLPSGISLLGGYDPTTWDRYSYTTDIDRSTNETRLAYSGSYDGTNYMDPSRVIECSDPDMGNSTIIEGFTIEGENSDACPCGILITNNAAPSIQYNSIYGGTTTGTLAYAVIAYNTSGASIKNNLLNQGNGSPSSSCGTIMTYDASCTITGNTLTSLPDNWCMFLYGSGNVTVADNTITSADTGIRIDSSAINATVTGNTIVADAASSIAVYCKADKLIMSGNTIDHSGSTSDNSNAVRINDCTTAVIENNTIIAGSSASAVSNAVTVYGSGVTKIMRNIIVAGNAAALNKTCVSIASATADAIIASNYIDGSGSFISYGIKCTGSSTDIINNTIIGGDGGAESYGIYLNSSATPRIINNIISASGGTAFAILDVDDASMPSDMKNNCFTTCNALYKHFDTEQVTIADVNTYQTFFSDNVENNTVAVDIIDGSLTAGSAAMASIGLNISSLFPDAMTDMAGKTRDVPITIGAYEY